MAIRCALGSSPQGIPEPTPEMLAVQKLMQDGMDRTGPLIAEASPGTPPTPENPPHHKPAYTVDRAMSDAAYGHEGYKPEPFPPLEERTGLTRRERGFLVRTQAQNVSFHSRMLWQSFRSLIGCSWRWLQS